MLLCDQCYNAINCDIYLVLQELINKNKDMNLQFTIERCDNYTSALQKFIDNAEGDKMTIEEAKKKWVL